MCSYCSPSPEQRAAAAKNDRHLAQRLRMLADRLEHLADGAIRPHTDQANAIGVTATQVVRRLVQEWI